MSSNCVSFTIHKTGHFPPGQVPPSHATQNTVDKTPRSSPPPFVAAARGSVRVRSPPRGSDMVRSMDESLVKVFQKKFSPSSVLYRSKYRLWPMGVLFFCSGVWPLPRPSDPPGNKIDGTPPTVGVGSRAPTTRSHFSVSVSVAFLLLWLFSSVCLHL